MLDFHEARNPILKQFMRPSFLTKTEARPNPITTDCHDLGELGEIGVGNVASDLKSGLGIHTYPGCHVQVNYFV